MLLQAGVAWKSWGCENPREMSKADAEETKAGRPPLSHRRAQILEKAAQLFRVKGYEATSMSDIADEVGITKAGLYYFVESKEHLLYLITDYGLDLLDETVVQPLEGVQDPREHLEKLIERHVHMKLLRELQKRGEARKDLDVTAATFFLLGALNWVYQWYKADGRLSEDSLARELTKLFLHGFLEAK
jgi:AcrR family transcriptional regulator